jgi:hypothetical protein
VAARLSRPFETWSEGLLNLCDALKDPDREKIVASRLEATAETTGATAQQVCSLALVIPCSARFEKEIFEPVPHPMADVAEQLARKLGSSLDETFAEIMLARERLSELVLKSFARTDPRQLLNDTVLGLAAAVLADLSSRLGSDDPFFRLAQRLSLYFRPFLEFSRYGVEYPAGGRSVSSAVLKLTERFSGDDVSAGELLRIWAGRQEVERTTEGIENIRRLAGEFPSLPASVLLIKAEICSSLMQQLIEEFSSHGVWDDELIGELSTLISALTSWEDGRPATADLRAWIRNPKKFQLLFDPSFVFSEARFCDGNMDGLTPLLITTFTIIRRHGHAAFPSGPLPIDSAIFAEDTGMFSALLENAPDAAEMIRLLGKDHGDWADCDLYRDSWASERSPHAISISEAVDHARNRGDFALCDILIGCWLLYCTQFMQEPLPDHAGLAQRINALPFEHRRSVNASLSELRLREPATSLMRRDLDALLSWLPPIPVAQAEELESELRLEFLPELWDALSHREKQQLVDAEHEVREMRKLGPEEANKKLLRLASFVSTWAAVSENLLFRALCKVDGKNAKLSGEERTLGRLVNTMFELIKLSQKERWDWQSHRRASLIDWDTNALLRELNEKNVKRGKHIVDDGSLTWDDIVHFRSHLYYGGALKALMRASRGRSV